jgi:hypothetical protein
LLYFPLVSDQTTWLWTEAKQEYLTGCEGVRARGVRVRLVPALSRRVTHSPGVEVDLGEKLGVKVELGVKVCTSASEVVTALASVWAEVVCIKGRLD